MFRFEPEAELRRVERASPDPRHRGISLVNVSWELDTGAEVVALQPGIGEVVEAAQARRPQLVTETGGRFWWMYEGCLYSGPDWLSPASVARLADGAGAIETGRADRLRRGALSLSAPAGLMATLADSTPLI